jgi:hypothetical protein
MSGARTTVGIVEWAARACRARTLEMRLAVRLGDAVRAVPDPARKAVLARHARHHAFHAELWDGVVPTLHDLTVSGDPAGDPGFAGIVAILDESGDDAEQLHRALDALPSLVALYREWAEETSVIADRPIMRVLDLVLRDEELDMREAESL